MTKTARPAPALPGALDIFSGAMPLWRGNIHTHSTLSDGALAPEAVIAAYKAAGYDFMMLSDHFLKIFNWPIADTRGLRSNSFTTLIGSEIHAPQTSAGELWHIVAAGLPLDFPPCGPDETGPQLARRAAAAGAFVGIAHPAWSQLTLDDAQALDAAHGVEIYNHGCATENDRGEGWYLLDEMLNRGHRLTGFATDDAHFKTDDAFGGWVHVASPALDPDLILEALKAGRYYSSQGPQIQSVSLEGDEITIKCSPVNAISVVCGKSRTAQRVGKSITSATLDMSRLDKGWMVKSPAHWFRIVVIDAAGKRAWSNPVWRDELNF